MFINELSSGIAGAIFKSVLLRRGTEERTLCQRTNSRRMHIQGRQGTVRRELRRSHTLKQSNK